MFIELGILGRDDDLSEAGIMAKKNIHSFDTDERHCLAPHLHRAGLEKQHSTGSIRGGAPSSRVEWLHCRKVCAQKDSRPRHENRPNAPERAPRRP